MDGWIVRSLARSLTAKLAAAGPPKRDGIMAIQVLLWLIGCPCIVYHPVGLGWAGLGFFSLEPLEWQPTNH